MIDSLASIPVDILELDFFKKREITAYLQREDLIHPEISGNKFRKLKYNIEYALSNDIKQIVTFGGPFSNHIAATAAAGNLFKIDTVGIIRGEVSLDNETINKAKGNGMVIKPISRELYKKKDSKEFIEKLKQEYPNSLILPEGGSNDLAVKGCREILSESPEFDYVFVAVGTGGTFAGIIPTLKTSQNAIGISVLKNNFSVEEDISNFLKAAKCQVQRKQWELSFDYHFGGYAKFNQQLYSFINTIYRETKIKLDPIYTGKMMLGAQSYIREKDLKSCKILFIHTGGLQGVTAFEKRFKKNLF